ncbi:MAG: LCP family protein [Eubacteriales bacterium]|nr:LCP family protein [Eubacteriales bacterium]
MEERQSERRVSKIAKRNQSGKAKQRKVLFAVGTILQLISVLLTLVVGYYLLRYGLLPTDKRMMALGVLAVIQLLVLLVHLGGVKRMGLRIFHMILSLILIAVMGLGAWYLHKGFSTLSLLNRNAKVQRVQMLIMVKADSSLQALNELIDKRTVAPTGNDKENIENFLKKIREEENITLKPAEVASYTDGLQEVVDSKADAAIVSQAYYHLIEAEKPELASQVRILATASVAVEVEENPQVEENRTNQSTFNVYISGIDTYGPVGTVSRSDVNIVMTVNPTLKKILLTTVPRDSYVAIADGGGNQMDKLTHAGIYGVQASKHTLENLLNTRMDYYARINFSSLIQMVDVLGGVTVENPVAFSTHDGAHFFQAGNITLNGEQALAFSRERYNLPGGDGDRGKNQMRVIQGIINKAMSPEILTNYSGVLAAVSDSIETDMSTDQIINLVNIQLASGSGWTTESNALTGYGQSGLPSAAMPGYSLYMMVLDEASVEDAKARISNLLNATE